MHADGSYGGTPNPSDESSQRCGERRAGRARARSPSTAAAPGGVVPAAPMFFFSNRLGCGGSILVSVVGTLLLLLVLGVIRP
ncbi:MAG: hypothetical protein QOG42_761 [Solirubrobacteraceae bacterium]|nr:hypothetical protein [Solirubrobacteraceae bacterium]